MARLRSADDLARTCPATAAAAHDAVLTQRHQAPRPQPPFNEEARRQAGFGAEELARLRR